VEFTAVSWNLFHGRDFPPDPALFTRRSRLLRVEERGATHVQVNRDLGDEFAAVLADAEWDVALLQECPPRFAAPLARACDAQAHRVLTSRNSLGALRGLAARLNPDLIASAEGGSNLTLVRRSFRNAGIVERHEVEIRRGRPERRAMGLTRVAIGRSDGQRGLRVAAGEEARELCVANLHATSDAPALASEDVLRAAEAAVAWAGDSPLLFGGDLNLRPAEQPGAFAELRERLGLAGETGPEAIDHLLGRGLRAGAPPLPWPPPRRELPWRGLALRLSDHAPVQAGFESG